MKNIIAGLRKVFSDIKNYYSVLFIAFIIFVIADLITNHSLIWFSLTTPIFSFPEKLEFFVRTILSLNSQLDNLSIFFLTIISLFAGVHLTMFKYYYQHRIATRQIDSGGFTGLVIGIVGLGCGSCGSVILSSLLGVTATSQIIGVLPLKGIEFNILSVIIIFFSIAFIAKKINDPQICTIK